jgi:hypothetical protein
VNIKAKCPNCRKELYHEGSNRGFTWDTPDAEYDEGYEVSGQGLCRKCHGGCYHYYFDNTPGYREMSIGECCKCGDKRPDLA